jgi:hypothetical protein
MKRRFRIVLVRKTGQVLGTVEATDAHAAETVAAIQFELRRSSPSIRCLVAFPRVRDLLICAKHLSAAATK